VFSGLRNKDCATKFGVHAQVSYISILYKCILYIWCVFFVYMLYILYIFRAGGGRRRAAGAGGGGGRANRKLGLSFLAGCNVDQKAARGIVFV